MRAQIFSTLGFVIGMISLTITLTQVLNRTPDAVLIRATIIGQIIILVILFLVVLELRSDEPPKS